jgi:hypothetical protein
VLEDNGSNVAGHPVLIAPVSRELPCKQGILQGVSQKLALVRRPLRRKRLSRSDFSRASLLKLFREIFLENRDFGVFIRENCLRYRKR